MCLCSQQRERYELQTLNEWNKATNSIYQRIQKFNQDVGICHNVTQSNLSI